MLAMKPSAKDQLLAELNRLIVDGKGIVLETGWTQHHHGAQRLMVPEHYVDLAEFTSWRAVCLNLMRMLGRFAEPWKDAFEKKHNTAEHATEMMGMLIGIKDAVERDLLITVEDLVFAEAFSDLLSQGEYLLSEGYYLAAGVLGRAVLEEQLRKWCQHATCFPSKARPTMSDFYTELQKASKLNKIEIEHVKSLAAVGNAAAHNESTLKKEDVERLIRDVRDFLVRHPLS